MKTCSRCKQSKSRTEFGKRTRNRDGLQFFCKVCAKLERDSNADRRRDDDRRRYQENRDYFIAKSSKSQYKSRGTELPEKYKKLLKPKPEKGVQTYSDVLEYSKLRKRKYKDKYKKEYKEWASTERGKLLNVLKSQRRRARVKELPNTLRPSEVAELFSHQQGRCAKCQVEFTHTCKYEIDHIVPVILGGGLTKDNVQLLCRGCNASKGTRIVRYIKEDQQYYAVGE